MKVLKILYEIEAPDSISTTVKFSVGKKKNAPVETSDRHAKKKKRERQASWANYQFVQDISSDEFDESHFPRDLCTTVSRRLHVHGIPNIKANREPFIYVSAMFPIRNRVGSLKNPRAACLLDPRSSRCPAWPRCTRLLQPVRLHFMATHTRANAIYTPSLLPRRVCITYTLSISYAKHIETIERAADWPRAGAWRNFARNTIDE